MAGINFERLQQIEDSARNKIEQIRSQANPSLIELHNLALALRKLAESLAPRNEFQEADKAIIEAAEIWRGLAAADMRHFGAHLARCLTWMAGYFSWWDTDQWREVLAAYREAIDVWRKVRILYQEQDEVWMLTICYEQSQVLAHLRAELLHGSAEAFKDEICTIDEETVEVFRLMAVENPFSFEGSLGIALTNLSASLWRAERLEEAVDAQREAVSIWRAIAAVDHSHDDRLSVALTNLDMLPKGRLPSYTDPHEWRRFSLASVWDPLYLPESPFRKFPGLPLPGPSDL
jgi:tetratricopeptide (TPR) repeat protein